MGHVRLKILPRTRKWRQVVELIRGGAGAAQTARATLLAAEKGLKKSGSDPAVIETVWLLMWLPVAARADDFPAALRRAGLDVSDDPGLMELTAAVTETIEAKARRTGNRSDLGEMAQTAAVETLTEVVGTRLKSLFGPTPGQLQAELARLRTAKQFGLFARDFFARFVFKTLNFFLSQTLPDHVGEGRFGNLAEQAAFTDALDTHCREAAKIVETFAGGWLMKHNWEDDGVGFFQLVMTRRNAKSRRKPNILSATDITPSFLSHLRSLVLAFPHFSIASRIYGSRPHNAAATDAQVVAGHQIDSRWSRSRSSGQRDSLGSREGLTERGQ
ncbi:hypothetical protein [Fimbriiglobus ruber]|uniref:Uncharacterized protein n=1 Tax=Fimbriiglobus ruber TaxID=1908690 RepID=A0A225DRU0_9BACT|nr:hypothetical protein [Fimbriiglobus ruber]OWK44021.1 hypothetical protein FRUB_03620 [Fimbriiglobus ruber]